MESGTLKGHIAMGAAAVIWGLMSPVSKLVMQPGEVSSASLATFRLLGAAILFWLASAFVPGETIARKDRLTLFYASLFGIIFNQMAFTVGVGFTSPADAAIITTITNTKNITMKKEHVAVIMNITTITIIMRMKYLQAGDRRPLINTQKRSWIFC